jgi:hypothetical protein
MDKKQNKPIYIGKGKENRIFGHQEIEKEFGKKNIDYKILAHHLDDKKAKLVEMAAIDLGYLFNKDLLNKVRGTGSRKNGLITIEGIEKLFPKELQPKDVKDNIFLINLAQSYPKAKNPDELLDYTRYRWTVGNEVRNVKIFPYVACVYEGIIKEVYKVMNWFPSGTTIKKPHKKGKYEFVGRIASNNIRDRYVEKYVGKFQKFKRLDKYIKK